MVTCCLLLISIGLLFVSPHYTALMWGEVGSWKFLLNLFTHQLDHGNIPHLVWNYMMILPYGIYLESRIGHVKFLLFFFACSFFALGLHVLVLSPHLGIGLLGSSGAAFGIFTGACFMWNKKWWQRMVGILAFSGLFFLEFYTASHSIFFGVARWAHIGGAIGALMLLPFLMNPIQNRNRD